MELQVGTILIAKDPCEMKHTKVNALIVGKEYPILLIEENENRFIIRSEFCKEHLFTIKGNADSDECLETYFDIKN